MTPSKNLKPAGLRSREKKSCLYVVTGMFISQIIIAVDNITNILNIDFSLRVVNNIAKNSIILFFQTLYFLLLLLLKILFSALNCLALTFFFKLSDNGAVTNKSQ